MRWLFLAVPGESFSLAVMSVYEADFMALFQMITGKLAVIE